MVGSQVLGVYVQGLYMNHWSLRLLNLLSIVLAVIIYTLVFIKFYKATYIFDRK